MPKIHQGNFSGKGKRVGLVVSRFNEFITQRLLDGAVNDLKRHGVSDSDIEIAWVPGSFEIPVAALQMALSKRFDAVITLGCIIKGETDHYEHVSNSVAVGVEKASVQANLPIIFGVITCDNLEQAIDRAGLKLGNKGSQCAFAALEMINLHQTI